MVQTTRARGEYLWEKVGAAALLVVVALVLWLAVWRPAQLREQNLSAVLQVLFERPDPLFELFCQTAHADTEEVRAILAQAREDLNYQEYPDRVAPYCTERGLELAKKMDRGLKYVCIGSGMESAARGVSLGKRDDSGYYPFTVVVSYGVPGEAQKTRTFEGRAAFDERGLVDYCYMSHYDTSGFAAETHDFWL